MLVQSTNQWCN